MKKIKLPKKTAGSKKLVSQKKKVQPKKKSNVIAFPTKAKKAPIAAKEKQPPAPPKVHPFAHFMKDRFASRDFGKQTRKLGSFGVYRKKAI
ncbi:MAG: hypothetical protein K2X39_03955 [Silvanigrellaceae bacterium]|nr:hypothetical protein [Silvanigrellaceae bacterium]